MTTSILYIASAEPDADRDIDLDVLVEALCMANIISSTSKASQEGGSLQYAFGTHSKRIFNYNFKERSTSRVLSEKLEDCVAAFEDLRVFSLPKPAPIPIMTHEYPVNCPLCKDPIDDTFQAQLSQIEPSFFAGVDASHVFTCDSCDKKFPLSDVLKKGHVLHRRYFLEVYGIHAVSKKPELLSDEARGIIESTFGPLALRHGWLT